MKLGTHMPNGERRKPIDIEVCRIKVKVTTSKNRTKIIHFSFVSARYLKNEMSDLNESWYTHA
jgi:hypothetical protein